MCLQILCALLVYAIFSCWSCPRYRWIYQRNLLISFSHLSTSRHVISSCRSGEKRLERFSHSVSLLRMAVHPNILLSDPSNLTTNKSHHVKELAQWLYQHDLGNFQLSMIFAGQSPEFNYQSLQCKPIINIKRHLLFNEGPYLFRCVVKADCSYLKLTIKGLYEGFLSEIPNFWGAIIRSWNYEFRASPCRMARVYIRIMTC